MRSTEETSRQFHLFATWLNYVDVYFLYYLLCLLADAIYSVVEICLALMPSWFVFQFHLKMGLSANGSPFSTCHNNVDAYFEGKSVRDLEHIYREWKFCSRYYWCRFSEIKKTVLPSSFHHSTNLFSYIPLDVYEIKKSFFSSLNRFHCKLSTLKQRRSSAPVSFGSCAKF